MGRTLWAFAACLILLGCASGAVTNPAVQAGPRFTVEGDHDSKIVGWITAGIPATAAYRISGNGTVTLSPVPPYLFFDGDIEFVVEPFSPAESQRALHDLSVGNVVIHRGGQPSMTLQPPGTAGGMRATPPPPPVPIDFPPAGR